MVAVTSLAAYVILIRLPVTLILARTDPMQYIPTIVESLRTPRVYRALPTFGLTGNDTRPIWMTHPLSTPRAPYARPNATGIHTKGLGISFISSAQE